MDSLKDILKVSKEELEAFLFDLNCDTTGLRGLIELLSENIHTCITNAITKITQKGYSDEEAERAILRCGPHRSTESNIVERALLCLESTNKLNDSSKYTFQDRNMLADFMTLEMVDAVRDMKPAFKSRKSPAPISVTEAVWSLLMCGMNVPEAVAQSEWRNRTLVSSNRVKPPSKKKKKDSQNSKSGEKPEDACDCECKKLCSMTTSELDAVLHQKAVQAFEKGVVKAMEKEILKEITSIDNQSSSSSCSCEHKKEVRLRVEVTEVKTAKTAKTPKNQHLRNIPRDKKGEYTPRDDKDLLRLESVAQLQSLKKELQGWSDWANIKVMQVTKQLSMNRMVVKRLNSEKEEAKKVVKDNENTEENANKKLVEKSLVLNTTNSELNVTSSTIVKLQSEQAVIKEEMEKEKNRSLLEAKKLEEALIKEEEALKKSQSFGSEKNGLEEELKGLRRLVAQMQRDIEKAQCLLTESEIRVAKEERETAKVVNEAESIKNERECVEALAMAEHKTTKNKSDEELKKYETEKKRIEYEISALKLAAESKRIVAMQKSMNMNMNMNMDSSKRLEVFKNIRSHKKKKKDRECVMCLNEEMAIVFVPCGHRVLCKGCNVKHKERMNECPSCRSPIHKRIDVRFAKS